MIRWRPDPTFYASPRHAMDAPRETLAYVAMLNPAGVGARDAIGVVDTDPASKAYGRLVGQVDLPGSNNELHHFGWNACSSHLCPYAPHAHVERRYLVVPGMHTGDIHVIDTKPDPRKPVLVKVISGADVTARTGYTQPHTVHCGPDGIFVNALGARDGRGPGGIFVLDHETFEVKGAWEADRGPQYLAYDFWWHLGLDTMITSEWGTPNMIRQGVNPDLLLAGRYGHALHVWDLQTRRHRRVLDMGSEYQMVLELRPAHDPRSAWGFVGVVLSLRDLSSSIWMWYRQGRNGASEWKLRKVIDIPARPAPAADLPPVLRDFGVVPPLVTDINLSLDDSMLYVSCWGTGELLQYDVRNPFYPKRVGALKVGGIVDRTPHPSSPAKPVSGGPQMVELSRDGRRVYLTNSLYSPWDRQFYPDGIDGWLARVDADPGGGMAFDPRFFVEMEDGLRPHQTRLQGGDASSDSFCYA